MDTVGIQAGVITIAYGKQANAKILNSTLVLTPGTNTNGDVVWVCGAHSTPANVTMAATPTTGTIATKYLPQVCRPGA